MQAWLISEQRPKLLLLDVLDLRDPDMPASVQRQALAPPSQVKLLPDPGLGDRVFVSLAHAAYSIRLAWMPVLAPILQQGTACFTPGPVHSQWAAWRVHACSCLQDHDHDLIVQAALQLHEPA